MFLASLCAGEKMFRHPSRKHFVFKEQQLSPGKQIRSAWTEPNEGGSVPQILTLLVKKVHSAGENNVAEEPMEGYPAPLWHLHGNPMQCSRRQPNAIPRESPRDASFNEGYRGGMPRNNLEQFEPARSSHPRARTLQKRCRAVLLTHPGSQIR